VTWERPFDQPVPLPNGAPARTLRDAANYIRALPKSERETPECRLAIQMLIDAAEDRGPMLFAKVGTGRADRTGATKSHPNSTKGHGFKPRQVDSFLTARGPPVRELVQLGPPIPLAALER
jgi:hypothetical protein